MADAKSSVDLLKTKGVPLERQSFTWRDLVQPTISNLDDDAFTRVRIILLNGIESEALRFSHACSRMNKDLQHYELGHLQVAIEHFKRFEQRDPAEVLPETLPEPIKYESHRDFVREVLRNEVDLRARGTQFISKEQEQPDWPSPRYRAQMNADGSPSETVASGYIWTPGTELARVGTMADGERSTREARLQERRAS